MVEQFGDDWLAGLPFVPEPEGKPGRNQQEDQGQSSCFLFENWRRISPRLYYYISLVLVINSIGRNRSVV